jgi:sarcosine oxidase, subunit beta
VKTENASIIIIGAGVVGSTGRATGGIRAQFETDININLSLYSLEFFKNCEFDSEYDPKGYLFFATTSKQFDYLKRNVGKQKELGVRGVEVVDTATIRRLIPGMNCDDIVGGSFGKNDGFINPLSVMRGFTDGAVRRGAKIRFGARVDGIETDGRRVLGVRVGHELIPCDAVVLCSGAIARELAGTAGIDLPVEPQRRQIVWAQAPEPLPADMPMVIDIGTGFHFRPAKEFRKQIDTARVSGSNRDVLFAYPDRNEPNSTNTRFDEAFIAKVYEQARLRARFLADSEVVRQKCRAGLYENTPDHHAVLGACDVEGLYLANGFSGHGVMHSPATGRALAEMIIDGQSSFLDVSCLSIERFRTGKLLHETAFI